MGSLFPLDNPSIYGTPSLYMLMPYFSFWFPPLQDTAPCLFKLCCKTLISQGSACPLMTSYPPALFPG